MCFASFLLALTAKSAQPTAACLFPSLLGSDDARNCAYSLGMKLRTLSDLAGSNSHDAATFLPLAERTALILYGSETGNAQNAAEELASLCQRLHFQTRVDELNAAGIGTLLEYRLVIFVLSTTGQGDLPRNSLLFWKKLLRKKLPIGCLAHLSYTCFGLGDSNYLQFNWAARKLVRRLGQLGASTFMEPYEADEQLPEGIEGCFVRWTNEFRHYMTEHFPHPNGLPLIPDDVNLPSRWSLQYALENFESSQQILSSQAPPSLKPNLLPPDILPVPDGWMATVTNNKRMTADSHWQDVRLISLDITSRADDTKLYCSPGDCLTLYPKNLPEEAERLIGLMQWESVADMPLDISRCRSLPRALHPPSPCTLRSLLIHNIDFNAVPRRSFLKVISYFSSDSNQKERLIELTTLEYLDEYIDYATRARRTILEVLEEFSSVRIPAARLLDVFPLIRGRDFSIANGGVSLGRHLSDSDSTHVELLVALVKYRTILRKPRQGLCSRYVARLHPGVTIVVSHKPVLSPIHGPANARRPLIAMVTGTGIAPVRSLIYERLTHVDPAVSLLFFGNRNRACDFFFEHEWRALFRDVALFTAFSRDQREKIYVQDLVRQEAPRIAELINQQPIFVVCGGSTKMADACKSAVFDPLGSAGDEEQQQKLETVTWWQEIW